MIKDVEILVAAHKDYWMPSDDVYLPIVNCRMKLNNKTK